MTRNLKEWLCVIAFGIVVGAGLALIVRLPWPTCKPGDPDITIGGMLMGGCSPMVYRNDGSVTPQ